MGTRVYLDTWILRALISKNNAERKDALHEITRLESNSFDVVISQVVLGEAFATIMRDYGSNDIRRILSKLYDSLVKIVDADSCLPPITVNIVEKAKMLKKKDPRLKDTDAIIAAQALLDRYSQRLLTADTDLLHSRIIKDKEKRMRDEYERNLELKVVDGL